MPYFFVILQTIKDKNMKKKTHLLAFALISLSAFTLLLHSCGSSSNTPQSDVRYTQTSPEFCVDSAYSYIASQCSFGPRTMNSTAHQQCGDWIQKQFEQYGAKVTNQNAELKLYDGTPIHSRNIIAQIRPEAPVRIMICSHWDSRPWADNDKDEANHHTPIDGANDGASGVAIMLEIARQIQQQGDTCALQVGVDLVCFDAEDCGTPKFDDDDTSDNSATWCLGSQYWASQRVAEGYCPRYGILLDMVGNANTIFEKEAYSLRFAPAIVDKVWSTAHALGYADYFKGEAGGGVTDDHVQVNLSGIPCIDIIGGDRDDTFTFPRTWHTVNDNLQHIDKNTLRAVGQTIMEVLWNEKEN